MDGIHFCHANYIYYTHYENIRIDLNSTEKIPRVIAIIFEQWLSWKE